MPLLDALPYIFPVWECRGLNSVVARWGKHPSRTEAVGDMGRKPTDEKDLL